MHKEALFYKKQIGCLLHIFKVTNNTYYFKITLKNFYTVQLSRCFYWEPLTVILVLILALYKAWKLYPRHQRT